MVVGGLTPRRRPPAGFAIISYDGRTSGRTYRTPMNVLRRDGDYLFALTYGWSCAACESASSCGCRPPGTGRITVVAT